MYLKTLLPPINNSFWSRFMSLFAYSAMATKFFYVLALSGVALATIPYCGGGDKKVRRQAPATTSYDPDPNLLSDYSLEAIDYASWIPSLEAVAATATGDALTLASEELVYYRSDYACILSVLSMEALSTAAVVVTTSLTLPTPTTTAAITYPMTTAPIATSTSTTTSVPTTTETSMTASTTSATTYTTSSTTSVVTTSVPTSITSAATTSKTTSTSTSSTSPATPSSSASLITSNGVATVGKPSAFAFQAGGAALAYLLGSLFL
jgi:hypothetical protein